MVRDSLAQSHWDPSFNERVVRSGDFDYYSSPAALNQWSWSNQVGPYQYYIHGSGPVTEYINFSPSYKNPGVSGESTGLKLTVDQTSTWNSALCVAMQPGSCSRVVTKDLRL